MPQSTAWPQPCAQLLWNVQGAELCKQEVFRQVEDRPVLKQRTRFMREHHIFEKTYVREVRHPPYTSAMGAFCNTFDTGRFMATHMRAASQQKYCSATG